MGKDRLQFIPDDAEIERICVACGSPVSVRDCHGYPYCEEHQYRAELMNWGQANGYPDVNCVPMAFFAIGAGEYCWRMAVTLGTDDGLAIAHELILQAQTTTTPDVHTIASMLPSEQREAQEEQAG